jgi:hypothetical protein
MNPFKNWLTPKSMFTGVLPDSRSDEEKARDWHISEHMAGGSIVDPYDNTRITESTYADENQFWTYSCVAHAVSTATETTGQPRPSHLSFYRTRSTYPQEGCIPWEMVDRASKYELPLWETSPTPDGATEVYANALPVPVLKLRTTPIPYFACTSSLDIALAAESGHSVAITIFATDAEWSARVVMMKNPELKITDPQARVRHEIMVLPHSGWRDRDGSCYVTVVDSAHFGGLSIRDVRSDFLDNRMYNPGYAFLEATAPKPSTAKPTVTCKFGDRSVAVTRLQKFLKMPTELQTGYYGNATASYVLKWQKENKIDDITHLVALDGRYWGKLSINALTK